MARPAPRSSGSSWPVLAGGGTALAAATAAVLWWAGGDQPALQPGRDAGGAPAATAGASLEELRQLRAENEALRLQLANGANSRRAAGTATDASAPVGGDGVADAGAAPAVAGADGLDGVRGLLNDELAELLQSGLFAEAFAERPERLCDMLVSAWLLVKRPVRARRLLRRMPLGLVVAGRGARVASALREQGDDVSAKEALILGLRRNPNEWSVLEQMAQLDPAAGLALLREEGVGTGSSPRERQLSQFRMLLALGDPEQIRSALQQLRAGRQPEDGDTPVWVEWLVQHQPALAVELLDDGPLTADSAARGVALARAMRGAGDADGARTRLLDVLRLAAPDSESATQARELLAELDPQAALTQIEAQLRTAANDDLRVERARLLVKLDRRTEAIGEFMQLHRSGRQGVAWDMVDLDPGIALDMARSARDDEVLGDLADAAWAAGRHDEARGLWEEANAIDPSDGEWTEKLRAVRAGRDPLN
ncbi:MAG: hypothetical protein AB7O84_19330 [Planctomycetota bacterium]